MCRVQLRIFFSALKRNNYVNYRKILIQIKRLVFFSCLCYNSCRKYLIADMTQSSVIPRNGVYYAD